MVDKRARANRLAPIRDQPTLIDVFAGAGGLSLGFEQAGFAPTVAVDSDERAVTAYAANFPGAVALPEEAEALSGRDLLDEAELGSCTVVVGGPPCAAFSVGGLRRKDDARRGLVSEFGRIVREIGPQYFVMENVPGILLPGARPVVDAFCREMANGGYELAEPWILDAAHFGVPQRRRRVFMTGARKGLRLPELPRRLRSAPPTVREAIGDLETLESHTPGLGGESAASLGLASNYAARMRGEVRDNDDSAGNRSRPATLTGCERVEHSVKIVERFGSVRPGTAEPVSRFFRLHPDRLAPTIRAGTLSAWGSHTAPRPIHYAFPRCITVREAARLQSMPDWLQFDSTKWRGYMQVGNAVPPLLARAVAAAIRRAARLD